jgi:hypothetical protein
MKEKRQNKKKKKEESEERIQIRECSCIDNRRWNGSVQKVVRKISDDEKGIFSIEMKKKRERNSQIHE